jgi:pimeloyl-ACP methyl ester carboxylesterase
VTVRGVQEQQAHIDTSCGPEQFYLSQSSSARHGGSIMSSVIGSTRRRFFMRFAEGFRVVRYDRPGTGLSDRDVPPRTQADELLATIADALRDNQFSLFAVSCAGPVALSYAATHHERIRRLVFLWLVCRSDIATPDMRDAFTTLVKAHWALGSVALAAIFPARRVGSGFRRVFPKSALLGKCRAGGAIAMPELRHECSRCSIEGPRRGAGYTSA